MLRDTTRQIYCTTLFINLLERDEKNDSEIASLTATNPNKLSETITHRPYVLVYQSKEMRECMMKYGNTTVSMDSTLSTTRYGFKVTALVTLDEFRSVSKCGIIIMQHETI